MKSKITFVLAALLLTVALSGQAAHNGKQRADRPVVTDQQDRAAVTVDPDAFVRIALAIQLELWEYSGETIWVPLESVELVWMPLCGIYP